MSDGVYVAAQAGDGWVPGSTADLGYAAGSVLLAGVGLAIAAAAGRRVGDGARGAADRLHRRRRSRSSAYEAFADLDPLAVALIRLTLLAVVLRLGLTLWWLSRSAPTSRRSRPRTR